MNDDNRPIILEPDNEANACIIWLHGLGADGNDFAFMPEDLDLADINIRFIFPHAPFRPVTINGGMMTRAWYDIFSIESDMKEDEEGILETQVWLEALIKEQIDNNIPASKVMLIGFSQGGGAAIHTGLRYQQKLGGILGLSTYLPLRHNLAAEMSSSQKQTPVMMMHGVLDQVVKHQFGRLSYDFMKEQCVNIEWREYPMEHTLCNAQLSDISQFIRSCLL